jgi:type II secretory pathway pseudopilin PulG
MRRKQTGEFLMARALIVVAILLAMLIIPLWMYKGDSDKAAARAKAEAALNTGTPASATTAAATAPVAAPRPIGYGLTFAMAAADAKRPGDVVHMSCHGQPATLDQPHKDSCNPYKGDTSCRTVLPVLCIKPGSAPKPTGLADGFYDGWTGGQISATQAVMGAVLDSEAAASARCAKELGQGWRMASFHDGGGGWGVQGNKGIGLNGNTRYWVYINDQPGNCWSGG